MFLLFLFIFFFTLPFFFFFLCEKGLQASSCPSWTHSPFPLPPSPGPAQLSCINQGAWNEFCDPNALWHTLSHLGLCNSLGHLTLSLSKPSNLFVLIKTINTGSLAFGESDFGDIKASKHTDGRLRFQKRWKPRAGPRQLWDAHLAATGTCPLLVTDLYILLV